MYCGRHELSVGAHCAHTARTMRPLHVPDEDFRALLARVASITADLHAAVDTERSFPQVSGDRTVAAFAAPLGEAGLGEKALDALHEVIAMSRAPTPRFFGYVLGSGEPVAALGDLLASILNQNVTSWRSAPAATVIERQVVQWLAEALGCGGFQGSLCGGGSSANLMGVAMARERHCPANDAGARPGVVYVSSEAHMSIAKSVALLGLGRDNLRVIPVDESFRMSAAALANAVAADRGAGRELVAVVASAGTTNTGAIDPLAQIASVCRENGLWLHVDGAYGAPAALALPQQLASLHVADSLSIDLHKWLYQPVDCGLLLYKDPQIARAAFAYTGDYARVLTSDPIEGLAFFEESIELSRRFRALKVWLSLRYHGLAAFREAIRSDLKHARELADGIRNTPELELLAPVELSAVCFRYRARAARTDVDALNAAILRRVIDNGRVYLSNASIRGQFALRACFVNHRTESRDVAEIIAEVLAAAKLEA